MDNFSSSQTVRKHVVTARGGMVASQHKRAAQVGAAVLAAGGDAVDAAVATSFAVGVVEPWMSGPAGGGSMMVYRAKENRAYNVHFGMRSPVELDPANYPLSGAGQASDLFPWAAVVDDRNARGATAVAVPGTVAGMGLAHETFGRMAWSELLAPAAGLAEEGLLVDWYASLMIAGSAKWLARDPDAAALFLEDGQWPIIAGWTALANQRLNQKRMAQTLRQLAAGGAREFYEGDVAAALVADVRAKGGSLSLRDLNEYRAVINEPLVADYRGARFYATREMTAGANFVNCLRELERSYTPGARPDADTYRAYATTLRDEYRRRLDGAGDNEDPARPACTTHFSVVDRDGNMCAVTQTLLSAFGSGVVSPSTGLLLNNGIMWFDPEPGRPNSIGPGKRCLMNVCPVIGEKDGRRFALGASGGRKILPAVLQLSSFMADFDMSLEDAFHQPRIDVSNPEMVIADQLLPAEVHTALAAEFPKATAARRNLFPYAFACPAGVAQVNGESQGCTEIMTPWGDAAGAA